MWQQVVDPLGSIWLSAAVAFLPILCFLLCLLMYINASRGGFLEW